MQYQDVSVIIATCNGAAYIAEQLDSVLEQTILPGEIIICDDQSDDDTVNIIINYLSRYPIKLHINPERVGVVFNLKNAVQLVKAGNRVVFADQDDVWVPQKLQRLMEAMDTIDNGETPALVYSDLAVIDKNGVITAASFWEKQLIRPDRISLKTLVYGNVVTGCAMMINYAMVNEFMAMDNVIYLHDEWLALIAYSFGKAKLLKDKLVLYRQHELNLTFSEKREENHIHENKELLAYISGEKRFLPHQFGLIKSFLSKYRSRLNKEHVKILEHFIKLENKNYIVQRINRRIAYL